MTRINNALDKETAKKYKLKLRADMISYLGNECTNCKAKNINLLQIDHIYPYTRLNSKYTDPKEVFKFGTFLYQLLCANCHNLVTYYKENS